MTFIAALAMLNDLGVAAPKHIGLALTELSQLQQFTQPWGWKQ